MSLGEHKLPQGWVNAAVGQLVGRDGVFVDGDWVESKDQDPKGDVRLIQLADVGDGEFRDRSARFLTTAKARELRCTFLQKGDLLIARMPDPLGRCCIFPLDRQAANVTVVDVCIVRVGSSPIDNKYLMYAINSADIRNKIADLQSGSTRKRISRGNLATIELPIAPLNEQRRIVAKIEELFSELDKSVESLTTAREQLHPYRYALLKKAFSGGLTKNSRDARTHRFTSKKSFAEQVEIVRRKSHSAAATKAGTRKSKPLVPLSLNAPVPADCILPDLPESWHWVPMQWLLSVTKKPMTTGPFGTMLKKHEHRSNGVPVLGIENIGRAKFVSGNKIFVDEDKADELSAFEVQPGDILISRSGTVGEICMVPKGIGRALISTNLLRISLNTDVILPEFFVFMFQGGGSVKEQVKALCKGSSREFLNQGILQSMAYPLCSIEEQRLVVLEIESSLSKVDALEVEIDAAHNRADALRLSILKRAFCGQLVAQDPTDEPASKLLERIRAEQDESGMTKRRSNKNGNQEAA